MNYDVHAILVDAFTKQFGTEWVEGLGKETIEKFADVFGRVGHEEERMKEAAADLADLMEAGFHVLRCHPLMTAPDYRARILRNKDIQESMRIHAERQQQTPAVAS